MFTLYLNYISSFFFWPNQLISCSKIQTRKLICSHSSNNNQQNNNLTEDSSEIYNSLDRPIFFSPSSHKQAREEAYSQTHNKLVPQELAFFNKEQLRLLNSKHSHNNSQIYLMHHRFKINLHNQLWAQVCSETHRTPNKTISLFLIIQVSKHPQVNYSRQTNSNQQTPLRSSKLT
jgi:hypothetical protein